MKHLITLLLISISSISYSQFSIDLGVITRSISPTIGINYQKNFSQQESVIGYYSLLGTSISSDNFYPTTSIQLGLGTNKYPDECGWLHGNIIFSAGVFWHTAIWEDGDKEILVRQNKLIPGATIQYQHYQTMPIKLSWDGKTTHFTIGWIF